MGRGRTWRHRQKILSSDRLPVEKRYNVCNDDIKLLQWAKANEFYVKQYNLKSVTFQDTGRGMVATRNFDKTSLIISIPQILLINSHSIMQGYIGGIIERYNIKDLTPILVLCTFLMCEKVKKAESFWEPYINSLPETYTTPSNWTPEEINLLPEWIAIKAKQQVKVIKSLYNAISSLKAKILQLNPKLCAAFRYDNFLWAWNTVNTRAVYMKQQPHPDLNNKEEDNLSLAPILDFLNHSCRVEVKAGFNTETNCYEIKTMQPYSTGEQVFISYGPHDNIKLLVEYGFVLQDNPLSIVPFELDELIPLFKSKKQTNHEKKKLEIILENNLNKNLCGSLDGISWNLQICVLIISLPIHYFHLWKDCLMGESVNREHALIYCQTLKQFLLEKRNLIVVQDYKDAENYHLKLAHDICKEQMAILDYCIGTVT